MVSCLYSTVQLLLSSNNDCPFVFCMEIIYFSKWTWPKTFLSTGWCFYIYPCRSVCLSVGRSVCLSVFNTKFTQNLLKAEAEG